MPLERLRAIMRRLRDPKTGCEWDTVQTFATIAPYTIEEAYEVADAIARSDMDALADELGDLQLQVVFHAQMAEEAGLFTLEDVIERISDKMERRHPHIFGDAENGGHHLWEKIKAEERSASPDKSALAGVALALPALERAAKLQRRAASVGFDWPDMAGPRAKIDEELAELDAETDHKRMLEELGDLLFAVVNLARHLNIEPEAALREGNAKFEQRFRAIEKTPGFSDLSLDEKEELWTAAKAAQRGSIA
ncbi:MAG TPA: nucleoside triphosphate pyrophosphohydrolase [Sphingomicrobium sp.]|nr:nucleoside triphosphate pyrophosphohydrolase [Sphingomicrobium sp.]